MKQLMRNNSEKSIYPSSSSQYTRPVSKTLGRPRNAGLYSPDQSYQEDVKLRSFKQILYLIKNADSMQRNEPDFFKENMSGQQLTKDQQVEFLLNQEKIRNTIQEVLDFNKSKINSSSQNKDVIGFTESQKILFKALEQIDNYEFIDQYFLFKKQYERQKKLDLLFKERIVDYRKRISSLKAKDCMKDQVIKLQQELSSVPFEKRAKQTDNMRFFIHKCQTLLNDRHTRQQDQRIEAMKERYIESSGLPTRVMESKNTSQRQSISQLYEDVRKSQERERETDPSKERNPLQEFDFSAMEQEVLGEERKKLLWQCKVRNSKTASTVTDPGKKPAFRIKKPSNEVQSSAFSHFKNGSIKEKIGSTETFSGESEGQQAIELPKPERKAKFIVRQDNQGLLANCKSAAFLPHYPTFGERGSEQKKCVEQWKESRNAKKRNIEFARQFSNNKNLVVNIINNTFKKVKVNKEIQEVRVKVSEQREEERLKLDIQKLATQLRSELNSPPALASRYPSS